MSECDSRSRFLTIQEWMVTELGLKGNELIVYALIYGFSQDGESWFSGGARYISRWLGTKSKNTVYNILKKLVDAGLLRKREKNVNGVRLCDYRAVPPEERAGTAHDARGRSQAIEDACASDDDDDEAFGGVPQKMGYPPKKGGSTPNCGTEGYPKKWGTPPKNGEGVPQNLGWGTPKNGDHNIEDNIEDNIGILDNVPIDADYTVVEKDNIPHLHPSDANEEEYAHGACASASDMDADVPFRRPSRSSSAPAAPETRRGGAARGLPLAYSDELWEETWRAYPRKRGKAKARTAYISSLKRGADPEVILKGVVGFAEEVKARGTAAEYVPYGETYFRGERWADVLDVDNGELVGGFWDRVH